MQIRQMTSQDIDSIKKFTDLAIGFNYYQVDELKMIFDRSRVGETTYSLVLVDDLDKVCGIRFTYPPGKWNRGKGSGKDHGLTPQLWDTQFENVAYFQSLFIEASLTSQGWGSKLSKHSIEMLQKLGAKAVVAHSWQESPNDSSRKYLNSLGFTQVAIHPFYWKEVDYICTRCGKPCLCTAEEMILYI